jgi:hypothetical protein
MERSCIERAKKFVEEYLKQEFTLSQQPSAKAIGLA